MKLTHSLLLGSFPILFLNSFDLAQAQVMDEKLQWNEKASSLVISRPEAPELIQATETDSQKGHSAKIKRDPKKVTSGTRDSASFNLAEQKRWEQVKNWNDCSNLAKSNFQKRTEVRGWVLTAWLHCARESAVLRKSGAPLLPALKSIETQTQLLLAGPWKNQLWAEMLKSRLILLELSLTSDPKEAWKQIDLLQTFRDSLDRPQRAKVLASAGELSQNQGQMKAAQFFYEQSLAEAESRSVSERLSSVLLALKEKRIEKEDKVSKMELLPNEGNYEERFRTALKANDLLTLMDDCISYLKDFPGGRKMKWAQDKILEIYMSFFDQSRDEKMKSLRDRALSSMEKADTQRIIEWARALHRRSDYQGALRLSEKALETAGSSPSATALCFIAGRSAQMTGDYNKARLHFEKYVTQHLGGEDYSEVLFRLGLVHLRMGQPSSAIATFEKLLSQKPGDKYELNASYWLARSLQATNNTRALTVADGILEKYPLSYYGLRLRMERTSGILEWPTPLKAKVTESKLKSTYYLSKAQKAAMTRIEILAKAGWTAEALAELSEIPLPTDATTKVLVAQKFNQLELFPPVIKLVNEAGDLAPEYRSLDIVRLSLPQIFNDLIAEQAEKQKLSPYLVKSLIRQESAFGPRAVSSSNAYGLMQLIGPTATEVANEMGLRGLTVPDDVFMPENNIQMGTYYIAKMIRQFNGNVPLGLAAYNAGPYRMQIFKELRKEVADQTQKFSSDPWDEMWFDELPWYETSFYVKAILRNSILYQLADRANAKELDQRRVQFGPVLWANLVLNP